MRRRRWLYWIVVVLIGLLLSAITSAVIYWRHTVPLSECSEVYRQYRHLPGVRAAFIRQMPINDTLRLDMTLLEAEDSAAFADLLLCMGRSEDFVHHVMRPGATADTRYVRLCPRGMPAAKPCVDDADNEVYAIFPGRLIVAFFHTRTADEVAVLARDNLLKQLEVQP